MPPGPWRNYGKNNHFVIARDQSEQRAPEKEAVAAKSSLPQTERIRKFADENIAAEIAGDYSRMVDLMYPNLVELAGGREKVMNLMRHQRKALSAKGVTMVGVEVSEPTQVASGKDKEFAIVPVIVRLKGPKGTPLLREKSFYIAISSDRGDTWTFLDGGDDVTEKYVTALFPDFPTQLSIPKSEQPVFEQ